MKKLLPNLPWSYLKVYVYLGDEQTREQFMADAKEQSYRLSDELYLPKSSNYYRILQNHTFRPVIGWAGNVFVKNLPVNRVQGDCLFIDYKHFLSQNSQEVI